MLNEHKHENRNYTLPLDSSIYLSTDVRVIASLLLPETRNITRGETNDSWCRGKQ